MRAILNNKIIWFCVLVAMGILIGYAVGSLLGNLSLNGKSLHYVVPGFSIIGGFVGLVGAISDAITTKEK